MSGVFCVRDLRGSGLWAVRVSAAAVPAAVLPGLRCGFGFDCLGRAWGFWCEFGEFVGVLLRPGMGVAK